MSGVGSITPRVSSIVSSPIRPSAFCSVFAFIRGSFLLLAFLEARPPFFAFTPGVFRLRGSRRAALLHSARSFDAERDVCVVAPRPLQDRRSECGVPAVMRRSVGTLPRVNTNAGVPRWFLENFDLISLRRSSYTNASGRVSRDSFLDGIFWCIF